MRVLSNIILKRIGKRMEKNGTKILTKFLTFRQSRKIKFDLSFSVLIRSFDLILLMWEINICSIQRMFSIIWNSVKYIHFMGNSPYACFMSKLIMTEKYFICEPLQFKTSLYNPFGIVTMTNFAQERGIFNNADVTNAHDFFWTKRFNLNVPWILLLPSLANLFLKKSTYGGSFKHKKSW